MASKSNPILITLAIAIPLFIIVAIAYFAVTVYYSNIAATKIGSRHIAITPNDQVSDEEKKFNEIMIDFYSMANMAEEIFPIDTTFAGREKAMSDLKDIGIYYWNRNLEVLDSAKKFSHNATLDEKINAYKAYCNANKQCYELMYKSVDERSPKYDAEINQYLQEIKIMSEALR